MALDDAGAFDVTQTSAETSTTVRLRPWTSRTGRHTGLNDSMGHRPAVDGAGLRLERPEVCEELAEAIRYHDATFVVLDSLRRLRPERARGLLG